MNRWLWLTLAVAGGCDLGSEPAAYTGTIEVTEVEVASAVPGRITLITPEEGDHVAAGELVFVIDDQAVVAERAVRVAAIAVADAAIEGARAQVQAAEAKVAYLAREAERLGKMVEAGVGSSQQRSTFQGELDVARSQAAAARRAVAQAEAGRAQAEAALAAVDQRMTDTRVSATVGGVVLSRNREPGEVVAPGMSVLTLGDLAHPRLRVYAPLVAVESLSIGAPVQVRIDARPDAPFEGRVQRIASEAEFTPRDILTPEERVKRVFAVDIALEPAPGLLPGVPAEAFFR